MNVAQRGSYADLEVIELLADRPELLAIADAVAATQPRPRGHRRSARLLVAAAALAIGLAALPLVPWRNGESSLTARALAAIGPLPVVHAMIETEDPHSALVDLSTGRRMPTTIRVEYWFDDERARLRSRQLRDGVLQGEILQMRDGGTSSTGPVLALPGSRPSLTPGLAAFVRGYRQALAAGTARAAGDGEVAGRKVSWLEFPSGPGSERVAIDSETSLPVLLRTIGPDGEPSTLAWRVLTIETIQRRELDFRAPRQLPPAPYRGDVQESRSVRPADARLTGASVFWLGELFSGLPLATVERQELTRGYPREVGLPPERGAGIELVYGERDHFLRLQQAGAPEPAYRFAGGRFTWDGGAIPAEGYMASSDVLGVNKRGEQGCIGQLHRQGTYVTIWSTEGGLCVAAARALRRIGEDG